jgi:cytidylate kinase
MIILDGPAAAGRTLAARLAAHLACLTSIPLL